MIFSTKDILAKDLDEANFSWFHNIIDLDKGKFHSKF